ncbi:MAG: FAD-binding oxidoreductase [Chloroflexota bacterium]|nr:FAD-binding oxidoreductase [Chloroflexota bacterium]
MDASVIVIGAGSVGANVAYRLAERGARVTVLDAGAPGSGTSGASFAWLNAFRKTPRPYYELNLASMDEHARLADELGGGYWHHRHGGIHWAAPDEAAELRETAERLESWGYPVEVITPRAAMDLEPDLVIGEDVGEVVFTPTEGYVEMVPLIGALLAATRRHGATILPNHRVTDVLREGDRVVGVRTENGAEFRADLVVDCAGPLTDDVARLAGVDIPFDRVPGRLVYTNPIATTLKRPVHAPGGHFRPDGAGRVVLAHGNHDVTYRDETTWTPEQSLDAIRPHLRPLAGARVEATRLGVRPMPRDEKPMVGPLPGLEGFYVVVSHSGVTLGPLWGRIAAAELLDGAPDARLAPFRPDRFLAG